ncbi:MAG: carbohydrate ABC transporter permease [Dictyoglomus thermophilum]|uniref:Carbohydrate ABC transporter permease n=1 Tax=Dictyoglomus thermophilum TaxID=14 RepID=A0A7C2CVJ4_DICTH|nr:carbohydrate ABC transporter permease [Dictyoglomus thermophilum]MCX7720074.1 carbohydrate ABC transporter permease [Dictyoglomus thermophilum]
MIRKSLSFYIIYYILITVFAFVMVYPLLWLIGSSFKTHQEIFSNMTSLIPKKITFENYIEGWKGFGGITFATFFKNSFILSTGVTIGVLISSTMIAYGLSRIAFPGRNFWFTTIMLTLLLPGQVLIVPRYILFYKLGWVNSFKPLIIPAFFGGPFFIFLMMQFIRGIPYEYDEAASIDGASKYQIFWYIILPGLKPAIITSIIFAFYWTWDDFMGPLLYLNKPELYPVALALKAFADPTTITNWGAVFAMSVLSLVPIFFIFVFFQKYMEAGIATTSVSKL